MVTPNTQAALFLAAPAAEASDAAEAAEDTTAAAIKVLASMTTPLTADAALPFLKMAYLHVRDTAAVAVAADDTAEAVAAEAVASDDAADDAAEAVAAHEAAEDAAEDAASYVFPPSSSSDDDDDDG